VVDYLLSIPKFIFAKRLFYYIQHELSSPARFGAQVEVLEPHVHG